MMKKIYISFTILILALLILILPGVANAGDLDVRIAGDKLSLHASQVPLQDILRKIADLGIIIRIDPQLNRKISASFKDWDMQRGLGSILKPYSHVMIWTSIEGPAGPISKLAEIQVFKPGKKERMKRLETRTGLPVARNPLDGSLFVENELLLRVKQEMSLLEFKRLLRRIGGIIVDSNTALGVYKIRLTGNVDVPYIADQISLHPGIAKAEPNYVYPISIPYKGTSPIESVFDYSNIQAPEGQAPIAIVDTGWSADSGLENVVRASLDALNPEEPTADHLGHGTQMALIAAGIVKPYGGAADSENQSPVIPIKAFDDNGFTSNFAIMRSIDFALDNGARVMSLSWGSETKSGFLEEALDYAKSKDLIIVASAGNRPTGKEVYPAAYSSVIGVGALGPDGKSWENSNYGDFVTFYAPGFATFPVGYKGEPGLYAGTSISAAFVSNIISNYLTRNPEATMRDLGIAGIIKAIEEINNFK